MDPIFRRLSTLFKSYLQNESDNTNYSQSYFDNEEQEAWEELEEFLKTGQTKSSTHYQDHRQKQDQNMSQEEILLQKAYMVLGLKSEATFEEIKQRHKELLLKNHPDKHTDSDFSQKTATEKTQAINEAFQLIKKKKKYR
ncbi:J domain-containing protein [Spirochaeta cellobiosiphila]|uniref:J domain-containing protein n=1 Tax=Spirochaeta cellobiosiphila TaxID=504483 RepID=UPI000417D80D|nr:J domain-containing protein [Spirochaeta cellobiosiphila]